MAAIGLGRTCCRISRSQVQRAILYVDRCHPGLTTISCRHKGSQKPPEEIDLNEPIKFSTSRAATWKARETYGGKVVEKRLWYEPYVVSFSLAVFLVYFCYLREENNVDIKLTKSLYDHIEGLEEKQLELSLKHNMETGRDTLAIKNRLAELQAMKAGTSEIQVQSEN
nr:uncharacterized protein LOC113807113 isoform X1 [Penaeus vannamei]